MDTDDRGPHVNPLGPSRDDEEWWIEQTAEEPRGFYEPLNAFEQLEADDERAMTEEEWNTCTEPLAMLRLLEGASERKVRLFFCGLARRIWPLLSEDERTVVDVAERYVEGLADETERMEALELARSGYGERFGRLGPMPVMDLTGSPPATIAWQVLLSQGVFQAEPSREDPTPDADEPEDSLAHDADRPSEDEVAQCVLIREIFGNPCRPAPRIDPSWLRENDGLAGELAREIDEERRFDRLPLLADVLEEAGCADAEVLGHCRVRGVHVRGCWVIDLLLGKR